MAKRYLSLALVLAFGCGGSDDDSPSFDAAQSAADAARVFDAAPELDAAVAALGPSLTVTTMVPESVPRGSGSHTYVLPQLGETASAVADGTPGAVDTVITAIYDSGQAGLPAGAGAQIDLYLLDRETGAALQAMGGSAVCDPCVFNVGTTTRSVSTSISALVAAAGGFTGPVDAFAIMVVGGADPDGASIEATTRRLAPHPLSMSEAPLQPHAGADNTFVIPHFSETAGDPLADAGARDFVLHLLYTGGLATVPNGGGAAVDLYLFDGSGDRLEGPTSNAVCDPCSINVSATGRAESFRIETFIAAAGGFPSPETDFYGVAILNGADPSAAVLWATRAESSGG